MLPTHLEGNYDLSGGTSFYCVLARPDNRRVAGLVTLGNQSRIMGEAQVMIALIQCRMIFLATSWNAGGAFRECHHDAH